MISLRFVCTGRRRAYGRHEAKRRHAHRSHASRTSSKTYLTTRRGCVSCTLFLVAFICFSFFLAFDWTDGWIVDGRLASVLFYAHVIIMLRPSQNPDYHEALHP